MATGSEAVIDASRGVAPASWVPADERDAFISWLRGEFAAANAIIDALCHHLQTLAASPGEYDLVLSSIHQRRYNWNPVLHMQQYYSVAEVLFSLQQVAYRKQQFMLNGEEPKLDAKTKPEEGSGGGVGNEVEDNASSGGGSDNEEQRPAGASYSNGSMKKHLAEISVCKKGTSDEETIGVQSHQSSPKSYNGLEEVDGQQVNVLDGLEIHENVFDTEEASRIATLVMESHSAKKKNNNNKAGAGNKLTSSKVKPKEVIQFGTIPSDILAGDSPKPAPAFTEETPEPMPAYLESIIDHLVKSHIVPASKRPDSCSISVLEPGDYMPPHRHSTFEQPLYVLSLGSLSELTFGRNMKTSTSGEPNATYNVALPVGSVLVLQGNSAKMVQCAVASMQSTRLLVTFGKMAKRTLKPLPTSPVASTSPVSPTALNVNGHTFVPASLQTPPVPVVVPVRTPVVQPQVLPTQPMIVTSIAPYTPVTVVSAGWSTTPPARVPSPGTGVFLPAKATSVYNSNNHHHHHMNGSHRRHAAAHHFHNATTSNGHAIAEKEVAAA